MAEPIRTLSIVLELIDNATRKLNIVQETLSDFEGKTVAVSVTANVENITKNFNNVSQAIETTTQSGGILGRTMEKLQTVFSRVQGNLSNFKNSLVGIKQQFDDIRTGALAVQVTTGGLIFSLAHAAMKEQDLESAMRATFKESYDSMMKWVRAADDISGVTREQRMEMAMLLRSVNLSDNTIQNYAETLEAFWKNPALRFRAQSAGIMSLPELAEQIKYAQLGGGNVRPLSRLFGDEATEDILQRGRGARQLINLMNKEISKAGEGFLTAGKSLRNFTEVVNEFRSEIGSFFLPVITVILETATNILRMIKKIPGASQIIAFGLAFGFVTASIGILLGMLVNGILQFILFIELLQKVSIVSKVAAAGMVVLQGAISALNVIMATNPLLLGLLAIIGVLIILETKFKIFSKALESLKKVDWAKAIENALNKISEIVSFISEKLGIIKGFLGKITVPVLGIGAAGVGEILKFLESFLPGIFSIAKDIYSELKKKFDELKRIIGGIIPGWLTKIFETVNGFWEWIKGAWTAFTSWFRIPWAEEKKGEEEIAVPRGLTPEEELAFNLQKYNLEEAQGLMGGVPAEEIMGVPGKRAPFEGKFGQYAFKNPQGVVRTGKELSEEQLLSGLWSPISMVDEFGGFVRKLSEEEVQNILTELENLRKAQPPRPVPSKKEEIVEEKPIIHIPPPSTSATSWETEKEAYEAGKTAKQAPSDIVSPEVSEEKRKAYYEGRQEAGAEIIVPGSAPKGGMTWEEAQKQQASQGQALPQKEKEEEKEPPKKEKKEWFVIAEAPPLQTGGEILKSGKAIVHKGEEVISEEQKNAYTRYTIPSILKDIEQIKKDIITAKVYTVPTPGPGTMPVVSGGTLTPPIININAPLIETAHIASHMDLDLIKRDLIKWLRFEIRSALKS